MPTSPGVADAPDLEPKQVAILHVWAEVTYTPNSGDLETEVEQHYLPLIEAQLRDCVARRLGPEFRVDPVRRRKDKSIELLAPIVLVGSIVMTYGALRQGLDYVRRDAKGIVERLLEPVHEDTVTVAAWHIAEPAMAMFPRDGSEDSVPRDGYEDSFVTRRPTTLLTLVLLVVIASLLALLLLVVLVEVL